MPRRDHPCISQRTWKLARLQGGPPPLRSVVGEASSWILPGLRHRVPTRCWPVPRENTSPSSGRFKLTRRSERTFSCSRLQSSTPFIPTICRMGNAFPTRCIWPAPHSPPHRGHTIPTKFIGDLCPPPQRPGAVCWYKPNPQRLPTNMGTCRRSTTLVRV